MLSRRLWLHLHHIGRIRYRSADTYRYKVCLAPVVGCLTTGLTVSRQAIVAFHLIEREAAVVVGVHTVAQLDGEGQHEGGERGLAVHRMRHLACIGGVVLCRHRDLIGRVEGLLVGDDDVLAGAVVTVLGLRHIVILAVDRTLREEDEAVGVELGLHGGHVLLALYQHGVEVGVVKIQHLVGRKVISFLCSLQCFHHHADAQEGLVAGYLLPRFFIVGLEGTAPHGFLLVALVAGGVVKLCHPAVGIILLHVQVDFHEVESIVAVLHGCGGRNVVALAGPLTNFVLAFIFFLLMAFVPATGFWATLFEVGLFVNLGFMLFNLIPIPPLDGSRVLYAFAPDFVRDFMNSVERYGIAIIYVLLCFCGSLLSNYMIWAENGILNFFF